MSRFFITVAVSHEIGNSLIRDKNFDQNKLKVIHNGIELPDRVSPQIRHTGLNVGTVGRMVPVKNYDLFLEIAARIIEKKNYVRFSILGDGPLREHLNHKRNALGLTDCINFIEPVQNPFSFYGSLDIYMNTSLHEGIPLTILEAMACELPVIAPNVGGIPEIITNAREGILLDKSEPEEFAAQCCSLIDRPDLRSKIGNMARQRVQSDFSAQSMAGFYRRLYASETSRETDVFNT